MVACHMEGRQTTDILQVHLTITSQQSAASRVLVIAKCGKHERSALEIVQFVDTKHHDQLSDDTGTLADSSRHVEWVGIVLSAVEE